MQKQIAISVIVAILVGAAGFFGGMQFQKSQAVTGGSGQYAQFTQGRQNSSFGNRGFGMATVGKVISSDSNSITVQMQDGSSKIVNISASTRILKTSSASVADLTTNTTVAVFGTTNSDGSITAQNVQINPMQRQRPSVTPTQNQ